MTAARSISPHGDREPVDALPIHFPRRRLRVRATLEVDEPRRGGRPVLTLVVRVPNAAEGLEQRLDVVLVVVRGSPHVQLAPVDGRGRGLRRGRRRRAAGLRLLGQLEELGKGSGDGRLGLRRRRLLLRRGRHSLGLHRLLGLVAQARVALTVPVHAGRGAGRALRVSRRVVCV